MVSDHIACAPGEWRVEASHIPRELQKATAAISGLGLVKVGVPDVASPDFTTYFVQSLVKKLATALTNPTHLVVPASSRASLTLRVEHVRC
ncbi:hypothetical protein D9615_008118 [Tricholomella constricta]|uniref:Uncharacterized protein n=1 Tax=Tricholomella constricta TaxID=117010 RepID=A0A8H5GVG2_9AGAR|nr:hypothetical protein D9615_008118 [Tricholomella constricta]